MSLNTPPTKDEVYILLPKDFSEVSDVVTNLKCISQ